MRTPTMIAIGGAIVLAVAWVLLPRTADEPKPAPPPAVAAPAPAPPAAPAPEPAPPPAAEPEKTEPAPPPPPPAPPEQQPAPTDAPAADEPAPDEPAPDEPADDEGADDEGPPPLDANHAADLLADWLGRQEAEGEDNAEKGGDPMLGKFDGEKAEGDPDWSAKAKQSIEATLNEWLANLPDEIHDHVALISVECRETMCQILAADNDPATQVTRGESAQEWQQAIGSLTQQPWWNELGFADLHSSMITNDDHTYLLYQTYVLRAASAPESQPEPPPES
jgi:type IV secretory pathway VirB10-like protein